MGAFTLPISMDASDKTPLFIQVSNAISALIRKGVLPPGAQLPGTRALSATLGIHRKTVIAAYDELLAQGWIETRPSSGTFVHSKLPDLGPTPLKTGAKQQQGWHAAPAFHFTSNPDLGKPVIKGNNGLAFNDGFPDVRIAPWEALSRAFRAVVRQGFKKNLLFYSDTYGESSLRVAMAAYLRSTRGLAVQADNILITRGSTMGIYLASKTILQPGDRVIVGHLSYGSANLIFSQSGATLLSVPVDHSGLDVAAIEKECQKHAIKMVYITPHHHYPTTVTMPADRRLRLLQLAEKYHFCILEDDYDFDFHYDSQPILPLAGADTGGHVVYVGSLCKAISPALRIGYVAAPIAFIDGLAQYRRMIDRQGDQIMEAAVARLFEEGEMSRHLKKAQKIYHQRRDLFCDLLETELGHVLQFEKPNGGMAVWARLDAGISLPLLSQRLRQKGLYIPDGSNYTVPMNAARLGFASSTETEMLQGIDIFKKGL
jgi:GntR family transcriptional regulator/MocR family aminotransferase